MRIHGIAVKPIRRGSMMPCDRVAITNEAGLDGDCRGRGGLLGRRQVTVLSLDQWEEACQELGHDLPWDTRRANICVEGGDFDPNCVNAYLVFESGVILQITGETEPCRRMDEACEGLRAALAPDWRGGVTCRVIAGGEIEVGESLAMRSDLPG